MAASPPPSPPRFSDMEQRAFMVASRALASGCTSDSVIAAAEAVTRAAEDFFAEVCRVVDLGPVLARVACGAGCSSCCHQVVTLTVAEAERLAQFLDALTAERKSQVFARAREAQARGIGLGPGEWWAARIPCPLLDEAGGCLAHAARGLACRGYNSLDVDLCRRSLDGENVQAPVLTAQVGIFAHAQIGLSKALMAAGIAQPLGTLVDTVAALGRR